MSAWIVSKAHIDYLVKAMHDYNVTDMDRTELGQMLLDECVESVHYRYGGMVQDLPGYVPTTPYVYREPWFGDFRPGAVFKEAGCYDYQSCEHPEYETSEAFKLIMSLMSAAHPDAPEGFESNMLPGYENAPWGIDEIEGEQS